MKTKEVRILSGNDIGCSGNGCLVIIVLILLAVIALIHSGCTKSEIEPNYRPIHPDELTITDAIIGSSLKYTGSNRMPNGGGENTTDWLGSQVARGWGSFTTDRLTRFSIGSSGGNRYQCAGSPSQFVLISPTPAPVDGVWHRLTLRYTATTPFIIVVRYSLTCGCRIIEGDVTHEWKQVDVTFWAPKVVSVMFFNRPNEPGGIQIDNVNLY